MLQKIPASETTIFMPEDVSAMRDAFMLVLTQRPSPEAGGTEDVLGKVIIRLYRMGLVDPAKLASVAAMVATLNAFGGSDRSELS